MKINFEDILNNQRFWIQDVHLYEFDPKVEVNSKKYPLMGIHANEKLEKPYVLYKIGDRLKRVPIDNIKYVYVESDNEKRLKKVLELSH